MPFCEIRSCLSGAKEWQVKMIQPRLGWVMHLRVSARELEYPLGIESSLDGGLPGARHIADGLACEMSFGSASAI